MVGLNIVDIDTDGDDFDLSNSNWIVSGQADTSVIFRISQEAKFNASDGNLLLAGDIGANNVLFLVDSKDGNGSFTFNNVEFFGYSFWDYSGIGLKNEAVWNNVRGCGQVVADKVNFNNVSMVGCEFEPETTTTETPPTTTETPPTTTETPTTGSVSEPMSLALLGFGLAIASLRLRRSGAK